MLQQIAEKDCCICLIDLAKNMNRYGAVIAELGDVRGDYIVVMNDNGQCPTDHFWELLGSFRGRICRFHGGLSRKKTVTFQKFWHSGK